ncbi:Dephospho-CoA kinase CoaE [Methanonatronarchaeum thermophilum]|uniref:Dephospho-CoA kinase CoaE n=1 Tax=Methanonatronarchaeum thermophilum TaxID=1927129 RepID=A0A1Y3GDC4_9EURY|nr:AAA family ATPase [Methanonatronarchaeum thermophilum]OUJ18194.1 Dephospho-CoA kinase CoaE [Methanonatronarchaeum thermophilum]
MKVIGFVGRQASGKTTAAKFLKNDEIPVVRMGDTVRNETRERGLEPTIENIGQVANELRQKNGLEAIAELTIPEIKDKKSNLVIIDGIRGKKEVDRFREEFDEKFISIAIKSSQKTRFKRIQERKRSDDAASWSEFIEKEEREDSWGLDEAIETADLKIKNENSLETFQDQLTKLVEGIK